MVTPTDATPSDNLPPRVPLSKMGKPDQHIRRLTLRFRKDVEAELIRRQGSITLAGASRLHTAVVAMRRHLQTERRLADGAKTLTVEQWAALADRSVRFKETCDRALSALGLDVKEKPVDPWAAIYSQQGSLAAPPAAPEPESQPGGRGETRPASAAG